MSEEIRNFQLTIIGDSGSGKTSLINKYLTNTFLPNQEATIGASFFCHFNESHNQVYRLSIWDIGGNQRNSKCLNLYCKKADSFIIVCDVTSSDPIKSLESWYAIILQNSVKEEASIVIFINKTDLETSENHAKIQMIEEFSDGLNIPVFKGSALNGTNVETVFKKIFHMLANVSSTKKGKSVTLSNTKHTVRVFENAQDRKKCC